MTALEPQQDAARILADIRARVAADLVSDGPLTQEQRDRFHLLDMFDQLTQRAHDYGAQTATDMREQIAEWADTSRLYGKRAGTYIRSMLLPPASKPPVATFTLTAEHVTLLQAKDDHDPDAKRPYGNSDVPVDVADLLGWDVDVWEDAAARDRARELHHETGTALQVILSAGTTTPGVYHQDQDDNWTPAGATP
ncbi:hypothetical protein Q8791_23115 [Nocardiopsis sp. CT-R113]|uniref:Uncharacterized protein n=1 Tax=Nocardiopsis codii TaxID=3065942 RepID=A0ABU7KD31_9ACTN|nr:hypothetical protein [Nocardiopsis sp. CT-R113]MEE2040112.1 hypothetical protein [Nocardiopsis sp. CT-R113]